MGGFGTVDSESIARSIAFLAEISKPPTDLNEPTARQTLLLELALLNGLRSREEIQPVLGYDTKQTISYLTSSLSAIAQSEAPEVKEKYKEFLHTFQVVSADGRPNCFLRSFLSNYNDLISADVIDSSDDLQILTISTPSSKAVLHAAVGGSGSAAGISGDSTSAVSAVAIVRDRMLLELRTVTLSLHQKEWLPVSPSYLELMNKLSNEKLKRLFVLGLIDATRETKFSASRRDPQHMKTIFESIKTVDKSKTLDALRISNNVFEFAAGLPSAAESTEPDRRITAFFDYDRIKPFIRATTYAEREHMALDALRGEIGGDAATALKSILSGLCTEAQGFYYRSEGGMSFNESAEIHSLGIKALKIKFCEAIEQIIQSKNPFVIAHLNHVYEVSDLYTQLADDSTVLKKIYYSVDESTIWSRCVELFKAKEETLGPCERIVNAFEKVRTQLGLPSLKPSNESAEAAAAHSPL